MDQNGANLRSKQGEHWYSVVLRPRSEFLFGALCHNMDIAFFVPLRPRIRIIQGQKKRAITPLFPGYAFCRADELMRSRIRSFEMVNRLDVVSDEAKLLDYLVDIDEVWLRVHEARYRLGSSVAVTEGPFQGIEGRITEVLLNDRRVVVQISTLGQPAALEIQSDLLEIIELPDDKETFQEISSTIREISGELIKYFAKHPELLYEIEPRRFEILIAELLADMGFEVRLTPRSGDRGRDILAVFDLPTGKVLTVVECRRFARERTVGADAVERLMWVADRYDQSSCAILATTSFFAPSARNLAREFEWRLGLKDFDDLRTWLQEYGTWETRRSSGLWIPSRQVMPYRSPDHHDER